MLSLGKQKVASLIYTLMQGSGAFSAFVPGWGMERRNTRLELCTTRDQVHIKVGVEKESVLPGNHRIHFHSKEPGGNFIC